MLILRILKEAQSDLLSTRFSEDFCSKYIPR
jgi:hypothetical protein